MKMFIRPPERPCFPDHIQWSGENRLLSAPEVAAVIEHAEQQTLSPGSVGNAVNNEHREDPSYRRVETCAILDLDWLYERILQRVQWANDAAYRFTLTSILEPISYLKYTMPTDEVPYAGHYDWHQDYGGGTSSWRKLTVIIQLSSPEDYEGCELQLCTSGIWVVPYKQPGEALMFPSYTPHCVTPITRGVRRALVAWIGGPQFQ